MTAAEGRRGRAMTITLWALQAPVTAARNAGSASASIELTARGFADGAALTLVGRARTVLAELGLQPPVHLISLEQAIVA